MSPREVKQVWQVDQEACPLDPIDFTGNAFQSGNWEHSLDSFFREDCHIWSAIQIKATKEHFDNFPQSPQPTRPRVRNPWPILKIRESSGEEKFLNQPDEGCNHAPEELKGPESCRCKACLSKSDSQKSSGGEVVEDADGSKSAAKAESEENSSEHDNESLEHHTPESRIEGPAPVPDAGPQKSSTDVSSTSIGVTNTLSDDVSFASKNEGGDSPQNTTQIPERQTPENASSEVSTLESDSTIHQDPIHVLLDTTLPNDSHPTKSEDAALIPSSLEHHVSPRDIPLPLDSHGDSDEEQVFVEPIETPRVTLCDEPSNSPQSRPVSSEPGSTALPSSESSSLSADGIGPPAVLESISFGEGIAAESELDDKVHIPAEPSIGIVTSETSLNLSSEGTTEGTTSPPSPRRAQRDDCQIADPNMDMQFSMRITELSGIDASWNPHLTKDKDVVEVEVRNVMTPFSSDDSLSLSGGDFSSDYASQSTPKAIGAEMFHVLDMAASGLNNAKEASSLLLSRPDGGDDTAQMPSNEAEAQDIIPQLDNMALTTDGSVILSAIETQEALSEQNVEVKKSNDGSDLSKQDSADTPESEALPPSSSPEQKPLKEQTGEGTPDPGCTSIEGAISKKEEDAASASDNRAKSEPGPEPIVWAATDSLEPHVESFQPAVETTTQSQSPQVAVSTPLNVPPATQADASTITAALEPAGPQVVIESLHTDTTPINQDQISKVTTSTPQNVSSDMQSDASTTTNSALETSSPKDPVVTESLHPDKAPTEATAQPQASEVEQSTPQNVASEPQVDSVPEPVVVPEPPPKKDVPPWNPRLIASQLAFYGSDEVPYETHQSDLRAMVSAQLPFFEESSIPSLYKTPNYLPFEGPQYDPLYIKDLPKLEEFIPEEYLPDTLIVHDKDQVTNMYPRRKSYVYRRQYPRPPSTTKGRGKIGHLYLGYVNKLGSGHWSSVYKASFKLPSPLTAAHSPNGHVIVAAKLRDDAYEAANHLKNEGRVYSEFPKSLMQDYCGYATFPHEGNPSSCRNPVPLGPVVPKFYGHYVPESGRNGSPILLLEHCGKSLADRSSSLAEKEEVISLYARLHKAGFLQGSPYRRNMLVQPGPLTAAPELRSMTTPSYRLIDFGRGETDYRSRDERYEYEYAVDHVFHCSY